MKIKMLYALVGGLLSAPVVAQEEWNFALSTGAPFFVTPEVSYQPTNSDIRYYGNIKLGLDNGGAIGFDMPVSENNKHALGLFVGSVGVRDGETECSNKNPSNLGEVLGHTIGCALADALDWERVDGIGMSYQYGFNQSGKDGWFTRVELGYGKGADSDRNLTAASILLGYQF